MNNPLSQSFELARDEGSGLGDIEMGQSHLNSTELGLEDFHKQVRVIEKDIQKLSDLLKKLQIATEIMQKSPWNPDANEESKSVTRAADMKAVKRQMEKETDEALKVARVAKSKIEELDRDNLASRKKPGCGKGSSTDRTRTAQTVALRKKLKERMTDFQSLRKKIQTEYHEVVQRRELIPIKRNGKDEHIFQKAIEEQGRGQVLDTLVEIQERHDAVKDIEKKLLELHQIFLDMAILVEAQGEMLDNIESHVEGAVSHVQSGVNMLHKARKLQKNTRKCTFIAIIILLIIVLVIVLAVIRP